MKDKKLIIIIILLLIALIGYVTVDKFNEAKEEWKKAWIKEGVNNGVGQMIQTIAAYSMECRQIPIQINENQSIRLIAVECLQR